MAFRIDSHQHFWIYDPVQYPWIPRGSALERDWLPKDLAKEQAGVLLNGSIAVQARQCLAETDWLLELAETSPNVVGVVGWVDLRADNLEDTLASLKRHPKFVGVRHVVQDEPDVEFMLRPDFMRGIATLKGFGLTYDILIYPHQLPAAITLAERFPEQSFVIDHLAKPLIVQRVIDPWADQMRRLSKAPNVCAKLSGLVTEASHATWTADDLRPYLDMAFEYFGPDRLLFGSDWPVCLLAGSYGQVYRTVADYVADQPSVASDAIFGGNAVRIYGIKSDNLAVGSL